MSDVQSIQPLLALLNADALKPAASANAIETLLLGYQGTLPDDYLALLRSTNGYAGGLEGGGHLILWPVEELAWCNEAYEVSEYLPGSVLVGSDGCGLGLGIDLQSESNERYFAFDWVVMKWDELLHRARSLYELVEWLRTH